MSLAKVVQVVASSDKNFDDAVKQGLADVTKTVRGVHGVKVHEWSATVENDQIVSYKVVMDVAFRVEST